MPAEVLLGTDGLSAENLIDIARNGAKIKISDSAKNAIQKSRAIIDSLAASETPVYGISTGFGALARKYIDADMRAQLQRSLIRSHAASSGNIVEVEVVRALMSLRLATLCRGYSGVKLETVNVYAEILNAGLTPVVREYGSLGCSGDLAPLSSCALVAMGEGEVIDNGGNVVPAADALRKLGITPVELSSKEGLALINGTDGMLSQLIMAIADIDSLLKQLDVSAALSIEALLGTDKVFQAHLHEIRPQLGQIASAKNLAHLLSTSPLVKSHAGKEDTRVQDAYSLRCAPQVAGAARDTLAHAKTIAERELRSIIDNPVVLPSGDVSSNGNFHGAPVAHVLDFLAISIADAASMSERRSDRMLDEHRSFGLTPFLADDPGVDSGMMIAQYTQAGLVSEMKRLAVPASVDSIPSSAMQEDHVSMGWHAARKLRTAIDAFARVIGIEFMIASRAVDMRAPLQPSPGTGAAIKVIREKVKGPGTDRWLTPEIESCVDLVKSGAILAAVEKEVGKLS
ncbi:MAG: histidine ammonia-lyase [Candidatus Nanopelagicaceae bacterium]